MNNSPKELNRTYRKTTKSAKGLFSCSGIKGRKKAWKIYSKWLKKFTKHSLEFYVVGRRMGMSVEEIQCLIETCI